MDPDRSCIVSLICLVTSLGCLDEHTHCQTEHVDRAIHVKAFEFCLRSSDLVTLAARCQVSPSHLTGLPVFSCALSYSVIHRDSIYRCITL